MTLGSVGIVFVLRGETISRASTDYSTDQMHESASENAPQELPEDLKIPDEIYHCVEPALKKLGFKVEQSVESLRWTKTYYYSNAIMSGKIITMIGLDPKFFKFGGQWRRNRWLSFLFPIFQPVPTHVAIFSDTQMICEEALFEVKDIKRDHGAEVVFFTKLTADTLRGSKTVEDKVANLKLHLGLD